MINAEGLQLRRSADASLLVVGVLMNPSKPEAGESQRSSDLREEKNASAFFDLLNSDAMRWEKNPIGLFDKFLPEYQAGRFGNLI
jgi:hypothetical protein